MLTKNENPSPNPPCNLLPTISQRRTDSFPRTRFPYSISNRNLLQRASAFFETIQILLSIQITQSEKLAENITNQYFPEKCLKKQQLIPENHYKMLRVSKRNNFQKISLCLIVLVKCISQINSVNIDTHRLTKRMDLELCLGKFNFISR